MLFIFSYLMHVSFMFTHAGSCVTSLSPKDDGKTKTETEEKPVHLIGLETTGERGHFPKRRPVTQEERAQAGEAARAFSSDFPFVIIHMTITNLQKRYLMVSQALHLVVLLIII